MEFLQKLPRNETKQQSKNHFIIERYFDEGEIMFDVTFISLEGLDAFNHVIRSYNLSNSIGDE